MVTSNRTKPVRILLVEDNPADVRMTREALAGAGIVHELDVVEDGMDAIQFLHQQGKYRDMPAPDLVLLDLNIPKVNGHEVLAEIKSNGRLRNIAVVVLTSSREERDLRASYRGNADCYVSKPAGLDALVQEMRVLKYLISRRHASL